MVVLVSHMQLREIDRQRVVLPVVVLEHLYLRNLLPIHVELLRGRKEIL